MGSFRAGFGSLLGAEFDPFGIKNFCITFLIRSVGNLCIIFLIGPIGNFCMTFLIGPVGKDGTYKNLNIQFCVKKYYLDRVKPIK